MELVDRPLIRDREGRRGPDFLLLHIVSTSRGQLDVNLTLGEGLAGGTEKQVSQLLMDLTALKSPPV